VSDPIGPGIVVSLSHPRGNITGVTVGIDSYIAGKWVELLRDAAPSVSRVAALSHAAYPLSVAQGQAMQAAASAINIKLDVLEAGNAKDLDRASPRSPRVGPRGSL
jgi:putative ABC transport system substrate-binding protein